MLVVLTILVLLAGVAVTATEGLIEQARYEATARAIDAVEEAILGPQGLRDPSGVPLAQGFVNDMGRLPASPAELSAPTGSAYSYSAAYGIGAGWRGPYLRLPLGGSVPLDGWGRELRIAPDEGALRVRSLGDPASAEGAQPIDSSTDLLLEWRGRVTFHVVTTATALTVALLRPVDGALASVTTATADGAFEDVPAGARILIATEGARSSRPVRVFVGPRVDAHARLELE